jgi:FkbM family methyltransferase
MRYIKTLKKDYIKKLLGGKTNPIIIEIGSHFGEDTKEFLEEFEDVQMFCFEPDPRNIKIMKKYCDTERINFFEYAVSDKDEEEVDFFMSYKEILPSSPVAKKYQWIDREDYFNLNLNRSGASSLKSGHEAVQGAKIAKVKTIKLDTWALKNNVKEVDFMWMDVQGAEKNVILGAKNLLKNVKLIYMEYGETDYEGGMSLYQTIDLLKSLNFAKIKVFPEGRQGNILFVNMGPKKGEVS